MKNIGSTFKMVEIPSPLWGIYQEVYFSPLNATHHYLNGAIISLWNPNGTPMNMRQNNFLAKKHISLISRQNKSIKYLYGGNADMSYRELSFSIDTSLAKAQKIALRCRQNAFYYVKQGQITLYNSTQLEQYCQLNAHFLSRLCRPTLPRSNAAICP
ncbi:DUF3293 domain-containing protein [Pseudoalteromonas luteoviolacea]|uniref:Uncharacterized protein n=1 Tax=Pseudoalteromonas luteoviolacea NCIMB 1942 TaxID=1365253 RepID=A0A166Z3G7_9GAMM|nr:DUF3293 domain-containing protein [Pseudoalteromonas luteoviolacea]KZN43793.1 hypothetical protein N482_18360 [Pseudoalteromonas luteoviolacea NCIMB 1942]